MLYLSEILLQGHDIESFQSLEARIQTKALEGEVFFRMDVKPPFHDTPENWEERLEAIFTSALRR